MRIRKKSALSKQKKEPTLSDVILHIQKYATEVDAKFGSINAKFDSIDAKFHSIDAKFEAMNTKMDKMHHEMQFMKSDIKDIKNDAKRIETKLEKKIDTLTNAIDGLAKAVKDKKEEQAATFFNYTQVEEKVEQHDKEIRKIKLKMGMA